VLSPVLPQDGGLVRQRQGGRVNQAGFLSGIHAAAEDAEGQDVLPGDAQDTGGLRRQGLRAVAGGKA